ncbi:heparan-alpha-glucosaminide N-acetyltransferase isoform X2 [Phyllopteryx taeniolatus]|uniref:heparan-alpha-glucosaminide N-acetyltransferase isoform X2 n=1 Tax=Phyllopteryx taeniolatus TaxID=161469 RepID=UPI002AD305F5|nr:heparan-alpha-glucosaminide N-acetyltransferase isoform X2 [Phyllopteryx taeniolatus]
MERITLVRAFVTLVVIFTSGCGAHIASVPTLKMDQALLIFHNQLPHEVEVLYTSDYCYKCVYQSLVHVKASYNNASTVINTKFTLSVQVESNKNAILCRWNQTYEEGGHYTVWILRSDNASNATCLHAVDRRPHNSYLPILVAALTLAITALLFVVAPYICRKCRTSKFVKTTCCRSPQHSLDHDQVHATQAEGSATKVKYKRLRSLDVFRGFALTVMVFVNYGGGGYWFFQHAPWNGLTVADLVMPWFVFIIGTSVVLAFRSMQRRGVGRVQLLQKITWRTAVLLTLGFCFLNYSPRDGPLSWSWLRIPGVLQRLGFTYFVLALLQILWGHKESQQKEGHWWSPLQDVVLYWPQWLTIILLETLWLCITFLLPVPNCPRGYLGAGGIGDNGLFPNCTGGAAGYIDMWLFGDNMYRYPTCKEMYHTTQPFDPEGILGTINSIVMGFLGMQAGKIIVFYKEKNIHILCRFLVWATILVGHLESQQPSFLSARETKDLYLSIKTFGLYFITDVMSWWGGQPFIYPGMNSIFVYVGHTLLGFYFPFSWEMRFRESHWEWLFQSLWGTALWVIVAYLLYRRKFFLKI